MRHIPELKPRRIGTTPKSWRAPGVKIKASKRGIDPTFNIDGLANPFGVSFPVAVTNLYNATIYLTASMQSPPAGWNDSKDDISGITTGTTITNSKDNATRDTPTAGTGETVTVRFNYRITSYNGTIVGYDEFDYTIYWESVAEGLVIDVDDFETDTDGWSKTAGTGTFARTNTLKRRGAWGVYLYFSASGQQPITITKTQAVPSASRAALFGFMQWSDYGRSLIGLDSPLESQEFVGNGAQADDSWWRFGIRLQPGISNQVDITHSWTGLYSAVAYLYLDYLRWVYWP